MLGSGRVEEEQFLPSDLHKTDDKICPNVAEKIQLVLRISKSFSIRNHRVKGLSIRRLLSNGVQNDRDPLTNYAASSSCTDVSE